MPRLTLLLALVLIGSLAACSSTTVLQPATGTLVTVTMRGGECAGGSCDRTIYLDRDGRVHGATKPPNDLGQVPAQAMATLTAAIATTDYQAVRSAPFTGECPVNFDGQELIFEFAVGNGTQRVASCEVQIPWGHPLFVTLGVALGQWVPMPLT